MSWQILATMTIAMFIGMLLMLLAVMIGGWLVFKAKTITMPSPFIGGMGKKSKQPYSYASDLFTDQPEEILDEGLSPAAARLRDQKLEDPADRKASVLSMVTGKRKG